MSPDPASAADIRRIAERLEERAAQLRREVEQLEAADESDAAGKQVAVAIQCEAAAERLRRAAPVVEDLEEVLEA